MKAFLLSLVALVAISYGANYYLTQEAGFSTQDRATGPAVRLD